jgi:hypothetical protein
VSDRSCVYEYLCLYFFEKQPFEEGNKQRQSPVASSGFQIIVLLCIYLGLTTHD